VEEQQSAKRQKLGEEVAGSCRATADAPEGKVRATLRSFACDKQRLLVQCSVRRSQAMPPCVVPDRHSVLQCIMHSSSAASR
jgi:hypothetical protein